MSEATADSCLEKSEEEPCCANNEDEIPIDLDDPPLISEEGTKRKARIAVAGCSHGEMDKIYEFDLLICCGDYQAVRNFGDLHHMHVNEKYRSIQTFYKYYSGEKQAPVLTLFIGGNHEASGYLTELPNGGWVAPNIYYMGFANVVRFAGLRIGGLSGIFNGKEFHWSHYERPPFKEYGDKIGVYHVRNVDMFRLKQLKPQENEKLSNPIDIMLTHDWPAGVADYGDINRLFKIKPYFKSDHESGKLGNPAAMKLLYDIRPRYWLSAHLHVAFAALIPHKGNGEQRPQPTRFLSLDKPQPRRQFIQAIELEIDEDAELELSYDPEWLAILRNTDHLTIAKKEIINIPNGMAENEERKDYRPTSDELAEIEKLGDLKIRKDTFRQTAPPLIEINEKAENAPSSAYYRNPQTSEFCQWLGIRDLNKLLVETDDENVGIGWYLLSDKEELEGNRQDDVDFGENDFVVDRRGEEREEIGEIKKARIENDEEVK